jgi:hypothetical protein
MAALCPKLEDIEAVIDEHTGGNVVTAQRHNAGHVYVSYIHNAGSLQTRYDNIRELADYFSDIGYETEVNGLSLYVW